MHQSQAGGWILIALGIAFLLEKFGLFSWHIISELWPLILIGVGIKIVLKNHNS